MLGMMDANRLLVGLPKPSPPVLVELESGEKMQIPSVAVVVMSQDVLMSIVQGVTVNVVSNLLAELERRGALAPAASEEVPVE
jgi:hypothetical protein